VLILLEGFFVILDAACMKSFVQVFIDLEQFVSRFDIFSTLIVVDFTVGHIFHDCTILRHVHSIFI
jgi:hypothetical protein